MQPSPESDTEELRKVYAEFSVKQLIDLLREPSDLRSGVETLIRAELDRRGVILPRNEESKNPEVPKPRLEIPTAPLTPADKWALRGGLLICILNGLAILPVTFPIDGYLWGACLGRILSTLIIAFLVTYFWKGRKKPREWASISKVFLYTSLILFLMSAVDRFLWTSQRHKM